jgi:DNA repair and recombination protein RAD54B
MVGLVHIIALSLSYNIMPHSMGTNSFLGTISPGLEFKFGNKDVEVDRPLSNDEFMSGRCFGQAGTVSSLSESPGTSFNDMKKQKQFKPPTLMKSNSTPPAYKSNSATPVSSSLKHAEKPMLKTKPKPNESYWTVNW